MKITMKKSLAVILSLVMCVSMLFGMNMSAFAADTNTVNYVYSGDYVYNWGQRGTTATFLSPMALEFYSTNGVTLDELLAFNGSASESGVPSSALFGELHELMESNHDYITSYDATKNLFQYTDCQNSGGKISSFYSGTGIGPSWNSNEWNREHVWPNSKGDKAGNGENDLMMLRPTSTSENSSRGNKAYGTTTTTQYYNPNDEGDGAYDLRGDCARIILYQYVRWECTNTGSKYNSNGIFGADGVIESKKVLLDWIEADPVDTWELGRNDAAESILGTRNIFVDYPELAFDLFNEDVPTGYTSPSGGTSVEGSTSGGDSGADDNTGSTPVTPGAEIVFELGANGAATHKDGSEKASYSETVDGYTLNITGGTKCYTGAFDATGNSAIKMGTGSAAGSFSLTAPDDVIKVIFNVAGYKSTAAKLSVNGTAHTVSTFSNNGAYTAIEVDTTTTKNISFATVSGGYRCMINSITFVVAGSSEDEDSETIFPDTSDDVVISGSADAFPADTTITITPITSGADFDTADTALDGIASKFKAYDITAPSQPTTPVTITLDIPAGYDADHVRIAYIDESGEATLLDSEVNKTKNTVSALVEHFSTYAVVDTTEVVADDTTGTSTKNIIFEFGANGTATHKDGSSDKATYSETVDGYTLTLTGGSKCYPSSYDATGKSAIKLGSSSAAGKFNMTVPSDVTKVIFKVAKYKANTTKISVNGTQYTITTSSNDGLYTDIEVDTTTTKDIAFTTVSGGYRCMLDSITYVVSGSSGSTPETPTYTVTANSSNTSHGTVTLTGNIITADAKAGYEISGYSMDPANAATVVDNGDGTFTVSDITADVNITINFVELPRYTATFTGNVENSTISKYSGGEITLPQYDGEVPVGSMFNGWLASGETETRPAGSKYNITADITFTAQFVTIGIDDSQATEATITFDTTDKRTTYSGEQQIWQENGIIVTNNKANSTTAIGNYANPARFYKNSELIVSLASPSSKITKIVFNANTTAYATTLANTIGENDNYVVSTNSKAVTITFTQEAVYSFELVLSEGQVQLDSINIYKIASSGDDVPTHTVKFKENGTVISSLSAQLGSQITLPSKSSIATEELVGWLADGQTEALAPGSSYTIIGDVTFTAKYKVAESGGSSEQYTTITTIDQLKSGTYKMAAIVNSLYYCFTGNIASKDLTTSSNAIAASGILSASDATDIILAAVDGKANTYTLFVTGKGYITCTNAANSRSLAFNETSPCEWVASTHTNGGIMFTATINGTSTYLGTNSGASSNRIRNYKSSSSITAGVAFFSINNGGSAEATGEIKGAQVSVGSDLSLSYYVDLINISDVSNVAMKVTLDGKITEIACNKDKRVDNKYVFTLDNIPPQAMTTTITAVLLNGDNELATLDYTIQQNAKNLLDAYPNDAKLKRFISDMLYYGEAAQLYRNYKTDSLATSGLSLDTQRADTPETLRGVLSGATTGTVSFKSATVWFDAVNCLVVKINNPANLEKVVAVINDEEVVLDYHEATGGYITDGIKATDFATEYVFKIYENDKVDAVQTLTYSVNAYASSKYDNSTGTMKNLALALYRYGVSAKEYSDSIA